MLLDFNCIIRMVPSHDRIVNLIGSVIDHSYGGGASPAVLLVMERYCSLFNFLF